jgi:hypothetical protein
MDDDSGAMVPKGRDAWSYLRIYIFRPLNYLLLFDPRFLVCEGIRAALLNR